MIEMVTRRAVLLKLLCSLGLLALALGSASSAQAKGGGGFHLGGEFAPAPFSDVYGYADRSFIVGGKGLKYLGPKLRAGLEGELSLGSINGTGFKGGLEGGFVLHQIANADLFLGLGAGIAAGGAYGGVGLYARPELGCQWNLGRQAIEAKLQASVVPSLGTGLTGSYLGLQVGMLFGDFPIQGIKRPRPAPPPPRRPAPNRRPPPPPRRN